MAVKYRALAIGITDTENGRKVLHFRMKCGTPVEIEVDPNQADFVVRKLELQEPCLVEP